MKPVSCILTDQRKAMREASMQTKKSWRSAMAPVPNETTKHTLGFGLSGVCSTDFMTRTRQSEKTHCRQEP